MPVPAPAETKTCPRASTAALLLRVELHARLTRHIGQRSHQVGTLAALRVVLDVAGADPLDELDGELARALDLAPERLLVEVVVLREAGQRLLARSARSSPRALRSPASGR